MIEWWRTLRRALTPDETLDRLLSRYDWPETTWWPITGEEAPPSIEDLAAAIAAGRPATLEARRRLKRRHRAALWALVEAREAGLNDLYRAVQAYPWRELPGPTVDGPITVDQVARALRAPSCSDATRRILLRGWGRRLQEAVERS